MSTNPYTPPQYEAAQPYGGFDDDRGDRRPATTGQRFANFVLDSIFRFLFTYSIMALLTTAGADPIVSLLTVPLSLLYYFAPELMFGWTLGKLITGTRVVSRDGSPLSAWRVLGRTLSRFVPFEPLSFLGGPPGWHDRWSNTRVIQL